MVSLIFSIIFVDLKYKTNIAQVIYQWPGHCGSCFLKILRSCKGLLVGLGIARRTREFLIVIEQNTGAGIMNVENERFEIQ